jgi:hypothetical protein
MLFGRMLFGKHAFQETLFARVALSVQLLTFRANRVKAPSKALLEYELPDAIQGLNNRLAVGRGVFTEIMLNECKNEIVLNEQGCE